jgi:hypothetical protein
LQVVWFSAVAIEIILAVGILVPTSNSIAMAGTLLFFAGAGALACWGLVAAHRSTCGCFGGTDRVSLWTIGRAGWLSTTALFCLFEGAASPPTLRALDVFVLVGAINLVVVGVTLDRSREAVALTLSTLRRAAIRPAAGRSARRQALEFVVRTTYWQSLDEAGVVVDPYPSRTWRQGEWTMMDFSATEADSESQMRVVAAVHDRYTPRWCRIMLVESVGPRPAIVGSWDSLAIT